MCAMRKDERSQELANLAQTGYLILDQWIDVVVDRGLTNVELAYVLSYLENKLAITISLKTK